MAECTFALENHKIVQCIQNRRRLGKEKGVKENDIETHLFVLRVNGTKQRKEELIQKTEYYNLKLHRLF
jgi:hypothetical protein